MSDKKPRPKSAAPKRPNTAPVRPASAFGQASAILIKEERRASSADTKKPPSFWPERLPPPQKGHEHLRYTSVYPCSSKLLAKKWDDQARKKHIDKIKTMKPAIDNQPPQKPLHLIFGRVKNLNEQEKQKRIQRENQILLERMTRTWNEQGQHSKSSVSYHKTVADLQHKSEANLRQRQQQKEKIQQENLFLYQRVQGKKPMYEQKQWQKDQEDHLKLLMNISRFPEIYRSQYRQKVK